nr:putative ribonuclease H-like domain-containing protein [Tanacetum cinerariifolium]
SKKQNQPSLKETGIFDDVYDDKEVGAEANTNNLELSIVVSPIPTTRVHKDHPKEQIIGDLNLSTQIRRMLNFSKENAMVSYINKKRRTNYKDYQNCLFACFLSQQEPKKVIQALADLSWIEAMQEELLQSKLQKVWTLVDLPNGKRAIRTKWVFRNKKDKRGIVVRNKARLVAQGYTQEEGIDYDKIFAPVSRIEAIRLFFACTSFMRFIVYQMDVNSAFLYGIIEEEVYVCQTSGFEDLHFSNKVYKVEKAFYGLHQAPRDWYETLSTYLLENRFRRGTIDKALFIKKDKDDILLVQVYVDGNIFGFTKKSLCDEFEQMMHKRLQMSSMGELTFFLGMQVKQKDDEIFISQDKYVADILKKFDFTTVKTASTLIEPNKALIKDAEAKDVDVHLYRSMIGSLMHLTASRPDIMFVVCACARFQVTPKTLHLYAMKRMLGIHFTGKLIQKLLLNQKCMGYLVRAYYSISSTRDSPFDLEAYSDSDYAGTSLDRKSTTGGCQFLGKRLIPWQCKKKTIVANSTTKAEYVAAASCCGQKHNVVAFLKKPTRNEGFHEIVDFLNGSRIRAVDNGEQQIIAIFYGKEFTITEASVKGHLQLADAGSISVLPNNKILDQLSLMGYVSIDDKLTFQKGKFSPQEALNEDIELPQTSVPIPNVPDEAIYEEWDDNVERDTTTIASLNATQDSGVSPRYEETTGGSIALTRSERIPTPPHDFPLPRVNTLGSDDGNRPEDQLGVLSAAKVLADATKKMVNAYTRRRRAVSTYSEWVSTASRIFSTAEESVSIIGESMPVSTADVVQEGIKDKGYKMEHFKEKIFYEVKEIFDKVYKQVTSFMLMESDMEKARTKKTGLNLQEESSKRQKTEKGLESTEEPKADEILQDDLQ